MKRQNVFPAVFLLLGVVTLSAVYRWVESRPLQDRLGDAYDSRAKLEEMLSGPAEGRWLAAARLGEIGDRRSVDPLLRALRDTSGTEKVCRMCIALGEIGDPRAVPDLLRALNDAALSDDVHHCAAEALLKIGDLDSVSGLIRALRKDVSTVTVVKALKEIGREEALPDLRRVASQHSDKLVRREARAAIDTIEACSAVR